MLRDGPRHYAQKTSHHLELIRKAALGLGNLQEMYAELAQKNAILEFEQGQLQEKVTALESRCNNCESSISELRQFVKAMRLSPAVPPRKRLWQTLSPPSDFNGEASADEPSP